eukprot:TRINITY_DN10605_c0_g1_i1.p1 TRINITY_DN10605_c0_g1~~TRINITY_DN10605_c0_g1_i1.p1  ORF type:complete len:1114 (-),score=224.27 TRINITY_DN10605_c0_g1_i1:483-3824(-)
METPVSTKAKAKNPETGSLESLLVQPLNSKLCCGLCFGLFKKPQVIHCGKGHTYCDECIDVHIVGNVRRCPVDGQVFTSRSPNLTVQSMVDELSIRCRYGCGEIFAIEAQALHEESCAAMAAQCPNGCPERVAQAALAEHLSRCSHRKERCECGETMPFVDLQSHRRSECLLPVRCEFCGLEAKRKEMSSHHYVCERRNTKLLANVLEVFNLDGNVRDLFLMELFKAAVGESLPLQFDWKAPDRTWVWVKLKDENDSRLLRKSLEAFGFPYVRAPFDDKMGLLSGSTTHLTFCPPLYKIDCPLHDGPTNTACPFRHKTGIRGPCVKWKCGVVCDHPSCFYAHPGKQVVKLQCMAGQLNTCKICNRGQHFGWECPLRVGVEKDGAFRALEEVLRAQGGSALLSQIKPMVTRLFPSFPTVLRNNYQDKLRMFLEQYPDRIQLLDMDHPGKGIAKLKDDVPLATLPVEGATAAAAPQPPPTVVVPSSPPTPAASAPALPALPASKPKYNHPAPANTAKESVGEPMYSLPLLGRPWDLEYEIVPFLRDKVAPYFKEVLHDSMTPREMLGEVSKLDAHLVSVDKGTNFRSTIAYMKDVGEALGNGRLKHFEPAAGNERKRQFSVTIFRLKQYQPVLSRPLHELRKIYDDVNVVQHGLERGLGDVLLVAFNNVAHACDIVRGRRSPQPPPPLMHPGGGLQPQPMPPVSLSSSIDEQMERLAYQDGPMPNDLPALAYEYGWPVCLHCGSPGHTKFGCGGCARCGRNNHVTEDCTQKYLSCGFCYRYGYTDTYRGHATVQCYYMKEFKAEFAHLQKQSAGRKQNPLAMSGGALGVGHSGLGAIGQSPPSLLHTSAMLASDLQSLELAQRYRLLPHALAQTQWPLKDMQIDQVPQSLLLRSDDPNAAFHLGNSAASSDDRLHMEPPIYQALHTLQAQQLAAQQSGSRATAADDLYAFTSQAHAASPQPSFAASPFAARPFSQGPFSSQTNNSFPQPSASQSGNLFSAQARSAPAFVPLASSFPGTGGLSASMSGPFDRLLASSLGAYPPSSALTGSGSFSSFKPAQAASKNFMSSSFPGFSQLSFSGPPASTLNPKAPSYPGPFKAESSNGDQAGHGHGLMP